MLGVVVLVVLFRLEERPGGLRYRPPSPAASGSSVQRLFFRPFRGLRGCVCAPAPQAHAWGYYLSSRWDCNGPSQGGRSAWWRRLRRAGCFQCEPGLRQHWRASGQWHTAHMGWDITKGSAG